MGPKYFTKNKFKRFTVTKSDISIAESIAALLSGFIFFYVFSPYRLGKPFFFQETVEMIVLVSTLSVISALCISIKFLQRSTPACILPNKVDGLLLLYFLYLLCQLFFYRIDNEYCYVLFTLALFYYVCRNTSSVYSFYLLCLLPVCALLQIVYGYKQLSAPWQGLSDMIGSFLNTGIYGGFMALGFVAFAGLLLFMKLRRNVKIIGTLFSIPILIQLIYSQSRAAWLAAIVGSIILLFAFFRNSLQTFRLTRIQKVVSGLLVTCLSLLFLVGVYLYKKDSADGRILIWKVSWELFKENPFTGSGPNGFQINYMLKQADFFKMHTDSRFARLAAETTSPFNEFLKVLITQGIIGLLLVSLILYFAFFGSSNSKMKSSNSGNQIIVRAVLGALLTFSCFSYPFDFLSFRVLLVFCLAELAKAKETSSLVALNGTPVFRSMPRILKTGLICILFPSCCLALSSMYQYASITNQWSKDFIDFQFDRDRATEGMKNIYPYLKDHDLFVFSYGRTLNFTGKHEASVAILQEAMLLHSSIHTVMLLGDSYYRLGQYEQAFTAYETASFMMPSLFKPHYRIAMIYYERKDYSKAKMKIEELLKKEIKIDTPEIDRMKMDLYTVLKKIQEIE
ncbi:MAG: O-antigen ligase family protein [Dysgonamonadaceae bacterium]|jgi:O-antigen ligase|nr:O-antigen ligase family protein [Dysgonamonadaceae bacterium]